MASHGIKVTAHVFGSDRKPSASTRAHALKIQRDIDKIVASVGEEKAAELIKEGMNRLRQANGQAPRIE